MDKAKEKFVDFIPQGQEEGSPFGDGGYLDFVPVKEQVPVEKPQETPKKGKK